jgi:UDP-N-acetylglucosamine 2-epimerase (hydrolysing)
MSSRRVLFLTGTRADYSKIRPLMKALQETEGFEVCLFITGMHLLEQYGSTHLEIENFSELDFKFINQTPSDSEHSKLAKTIQGFGDYVREMKPDLIVIHGDRIEAMAGALVAATSNILLAHIEGGEVSGTIDDSYRHAISKLAQVHFVANEQAEERLLQLGEDRNQIHVIGSPELDLMHSDALPSMEAVVSRYQIPFEKYAIVIFHPVATEWLDAQQQANELFAALASSGRNFVVIESNNDLGSDGIRKELDEIRTNKRFRILPSMRFDFFLTLLQNSEFVVGNSSVGVREAPHYGIPALNVGSRQSGRTSSPMVVNLGFDAGDILKAISSIGEIERFKDEQFGDGNSAKRFKSLLANAGFWNVPIQKKFIRFESGI